MQKNITCGKRRIKNKLNKNSVFSDLFLMSARPNGVIKLREKKNEMKKKEKILNLPETLDY